jgi:uncharacterized membrane-anchored protein YitT (DUF2179 family)
MYIATITNRKALMLKTVRTKITSKTTSHPVLNELFKTGAVIVGALLVAVGLELFLVPNGFLDGGVVGISIILTEFIHLPLGVFIGILNLPFLFIAYKHSGWRTAIRTALGIATLSAGTIILHQLHAEPLTREFILALGYGGLLLGVGVGLALRYGGALDGTEILAVSLSNRINMGIDQIILIINFFIFVVAAFVFTPERAMASFLLFYIVVTPIIKKVMEGEDGTKTVQILSTKHSEITEAIHEKLNKKVTLIDAHKDDLLPGHELKILFTFVARVEESALAETVEKIDPDAIIVFSDVANIRGGMFNKNKHH